MRRAPIFLSVLLLAVGLTGSAILSAAARQDAPAEITGDSEPIDGPGGVALDTAGTLYVIDGWHDQIRLFDQDGKALATWGASGDGPGEFRFHDDSNDYAFGDLAIGPDGAIYVADLFNNRIQKLAADGSFLLSWGEQGDGEGQFVEPSGIAVDKQSHVYVADYTNARIQVFDSDGAFLAAWDGNGDGQQEFAGPLYGPNDVAIDPDGFAWVTDDQNNRIYRFDADGALVGGYGFRGETPDDFWVPWGITIDAAGTVYIAEEHNNRIHMLSADGATLGVFGERGKDPGQFDAPLYVAVGNDGELYVADQENDRVQIFRSPLPGAATATP